VEPAIYPNEVVNLAIGVVALPIFLKARRFMRPFVGRAFLIGYCAMVASLVATILEGVILPDLLNVLEHAAVAVAGVSYAVAIVAPVIRPRPEYQ
jgi:hypothetical protein